MASRLKVRGAQLVGRVPNANDPRGKRNAQAQAAAFLQDGRGVGRDRDGRLEVDLEDPDLGLATTEEVAELRARVDVLEAALKAAGLVV